MTFPLNGSTNLGDPITDTGERRRREDVKSVDELKQCPCCGYGAVINGTGQRRSPYQIECTECGVCGDHWLNREECLSEWNTRVDPPELVRLREKVAAYREARWIKSESHKEIAQAALFAELDAQGDGK